MKQRAKSLTPLPYDLIRVDLYVRRESNARSGYPSLFVISLFLFCTKVTKGEGKKWIKKFIPHDFYTTTRSNYRRYFLWTHSILDILDCYKNKIFMLSLSLTSSLSRRECTPREYNTHMRILKLINTCTHLFIYLFPQEIVLSRDNALNS